MKLRNSLGVALTISILALVNLRAATPMADPPEPLKRIGEAKGIHPGRVGWVHDPDVLNWKGPGDGYWWPTKRLGRLGVHEHWNNSIQKQYSRNTGTGPGIGLIQVELGSQRPKT